jgi:hypothetical protein
MHLFLIALGFWGVLFIIAAHNAKARRRKVKLLKDRANPPPYIEGDW